MRLPNPYSLEETLGKLRHGLTTACKEDTPTIVAEPVRASEAWHRQSEPKPGSSAVG